MTISISDYETKYGEAALACFLNTFSCPLNQEVETYLKQKAAQSSKLSASQTYLVIDDDRYVLLGYYTLVLKTYNVNGSLLNSKNRRLISRFAEEDNQGNFHASVYLVAQIGKNFAIAERMRISGAKLIGMALDEFRAIKRRVGGKLVMVERESDRPKLLEFYQTNGFKSWTKRRDANDNACYDQMFATI